MVLCALTCANSINFLLIGMPFLKSDPHHFTCRNPKGKWQMCTKEFICTNGLTKDEYRADKEDSQYINNWVEQYDLLCESKQHIGFIGACFFIGVIISSSLIPVGWLSDRYGRKWIFVFSLILEIIACYWIIIGSQLFVLYTCLIILGLSHPGRCVVGVSYADEFLHRRQQKYLIPMS